MHLHMKTVGFMLHLAGRPTCDREHTAPASFGYAESVVLESPVRSLLRINLPNDSRPLLSKFIRQPLKISIRCVRFRRISGQDLDRDQQSHQHDSDTAINLGHPHHDGNSILLMIPRFDHGTFMGRLSTCDYSVECTRLYLRSSQWVSDLKGSSVTTW